MMWRIKIGHRIFTKFEPVVGENAAYQDLWDKGYGVVLKRFLGFRYLMWI